LFDCEKDLRAAADQVGIALTEPLLATFRAYASELIDWNQRINLTRIVDPGEICVKHFVDSLSVLNVLRLDPTATVVDVGAGAGFPGLPIKILVPDISLVLVESIGKKVQFLEHIIPRLGLEHARAIAGRAEELGRHPEYRETFSVAVSRSVAPLFVLGEYMLPLLAIGGTAVCYKGCEVAHEIDEAASHVRLLGGELDPPITVQMSALHRPRVLVLMRKVRPTPTDYPRRPGVARKRYRHESAVRLDSTRHSA
jgi:16S rRNA (guanine527-N7)-methyltransferase